MLKIWTRVGMADVFEGGGKSRRVQRVTHLSGQAKRTITVMIRSHAMETRTQSNTLISLRKPSDRRRGLQPQESTKFSLDDRLNVVISGVFKRKEHSK